MPLSVYTAKGKIKVEVGVAKSKKKYEKRELLKKKEADMDIKKALSQF